MSQLISESSRARWGVKTLGPQEHVDTAQHVIWCHVDTVKRAVRHLVAYMKVPSTKQMVVQPGMGVLLVQIRMKAFPHRLAAVLAASLLR